MYILIASQISRITWRFTLSRLQQQNFRNLNLILRPVLIDVYIFTGTCTPTRSEYFTNQKWKILAKFPLRKFFLEGHTALCHFCFKVYEKIIYNWTFLKDKEISITFVRSIKWLFLTYSNVPNKHPPSRHLFF